MNQGLILRLLLTNYTRIDDSSLLICFFPAEPQELNEVDRRGHLFGYQHYRQGPF